jgi:hypothetical protein
MTNAPTYVLAAGVLVALLAAAPTLAADIDGAYEIVKRQLPDGTVIVPGEQLAGYGTWIGGVRNFNVSWMDNGKRVALSTIADYTFSNTKYCETARYWMATNIGGEASSWEPPPSKVECTAVTVTDGKASFQIPGELPVAVFSDDGFVATADGLFVDYWKKVD